MKLKTLLGAGAGAAVLAAGLVSAPAFATAPSPNVNTNVNTTCNTTTHHALLAEYAANAETSPVQVNFSTDGFDPAKVTLGDFATTLAPSPAPGSKIYNLVDLGALSTKGGTVQVRTYRAATLNTPAASTTSTLSYPAKDCTPPAPPAPPAPPVVVSPPSHPPVISHPPVGHPQPPYFFHHVKSYHTFVVSIVDHGHVFSKKIRVWM